MEHRQAMIRRARRALHEGRDLPHELRDTIRHSWLRSRLAAAPVDRIAVPYVAVDATERLFRAAEPILDRFAQQLVGTPVSLVLADRSARVIGRWAGDGSALRRLSRVSVEEGFVLAEDLAGTNGVGTALEELAPVTIFGEEHYAETLQRLVCVGVPVRHPLTRRIEGVLDLACPTRDVNALLMPTALDLCAQIERELSTHASERDRAVFEEFVARSRVTSAPLVALSGQYMMTNAAAAELFEPRDQAYLWELALQSLDGVTAVTRPLQLRGGGTTMTRCTPVTIGTHPVGALIEVLQPPRPGRERRASGKAPRGTVKSPAAAQLEKDVSHVAASKATRVLFEGEAGTGKLDSARRLHGLRRLDTAFTVHAAGLAQVHGSRAWLGELEALLADETVTVAISNVQILDRRTQRGVADLLSGPATLSRLVMITRQRVSSQARQAPTPFTSQAAVLVPSLRQRREDIPDLAHGILRALGGAARIGHRAMTALTNHPWPGNFPQLQAELGGAADRSGGRDISCQHLSAEIRAGVQSRRTLTRLESLEREAIAEALREHDGNRVQAAQALGMSRSTLYRRLRLFGLETGRTVL
jgi:transcriptional regulator of acetoin/glycerol metabolism